VIYEFERLKFMISNNLFQATILQHLIDLYIGVEEREKLNIHIKNDLDTVKKQLGC
jgi:hypothetical protein